MTAVRAEVHEGRAAIEALAPALDSLHRRSGGPITSRLPWVRAWLDTHDVEPIAVVVRPSGGTEIAAALLVAVSTRAGLRRITLAGHRLSDHTRTGAEAGPTARTLADGLVEAIGRRTGPWHLHLDHLDPNEPLIEAIGRVFEINAIGPGQLSLATEFGTDRTFRAYTNSKYRDNLRRSTVLIGKEGLRHRIDHTVDRDGIAARLPDLEAVRQMRDLDVGVVSELDADGGRFWRAAVSAMAAGGDLALHELRIDDRLAAYVVSLRDDRTMHLWDGRIDPALARFAPGSLLHAQLLQDGLADPTIDRIDWGRGDSPYKRKLANLELPSVDIHAWSSASLKRLSGAWLDGRRRFVQLRSEHQWVGHAWARVRSRT